MSAADANPKSPFRAQAAWVAGARIVGIGATLAGNIVAARLLGPAAYGMYLLVTTALALGATLGMAGLDEAGLRFVSQSLGTDRKKLAKAYSRRVLATLCLSAPVAAAIIGAAMLPFRKELGTYGEPFALIALSALGVVLISGQRILAELLRAFGNLKLASLYSGGLTGGPVSNVLFLAAIGIGFVLLGSVDLDLAVMMTVVSVAVTFPLAWLGLKLTSKSVAGEQPAESLSRVRKRAMAAVGFTLLVNQLLAFGSQQFDIWLGAWLLEPEALGMYGAAKRCLLLAAMPVQMAMMTIVASIPRLHARKETAQLQRLMRSTATYAAIPAVAALLLLTLFPEQLLQLAFGDSYTGATPTVLVLVVGYLVLVLLGNPPHLLAMTGMHRTVLAVNLAATATLIAVGSLGALQFGAPGLAAGSAASLIVQNGLLWWFARRRLRVWTHVGNPWGRPEAGGRRPDDSDAVSKETDSLHRIEGHPNRNASPTNPTASTLEPTASQ